MKYEVRVGKRALQVEVDGTRVRVDGTEVAAQLEPIPGTPLYHLLLDGASWTIAAQPSDANRWTLGLIGERIEVEATDELTRRIRDLTAQRPQRAGSTTLQAPMPGLVVRIAAAEGQHVDGGSSLIVVEAMKMENELRASRAGIVKQIHVRVGDAVEKGTPLITLHHPET
jgi:biotin carboxyl carrier protein